MNNEMSHFLVVVMATPRELETPADRLERRLDKIKEEVLGALEKVDTFPHPLYLFALRITRPAHLPLVDRLIAWLPSQGYTARCGYADRQYEALIVEKKK